MSVRIVETIAAVRQELDRARSEGASIGLVPTMGALHEGHASLMDRARGECDVVAVSIFVNPTQFGPNEDYSRYPRPFARDLALCGERGVDLIFHPDVPEMYPSDTRTSVEVTKLDAHLCGPFRPGHFRGVATVVLKLLHIVQPAKAYFGEKDFQQLSIIRRMTEDLNLPVAIVGAPTLREPDGLALSSRNVYLQPDEREAAPLLFRSLEAARRAIEDGEDEAASAVREGERLLRSDPRIRIEYLQIVDCRELQPLERIDRPVRIAAAIWIGKTRLIDNVAAAPR